MVNTRMTWCRWQRRGFDDGASPSVGMFIIGQDLFSLLSIRVVKALNCKTIENHKNPDNKIHVSGQQQVEPAWKFQTQQIKMSGIIYFELFKPASTCVRSRAYAKNGFTILSLRSKTYFSHHICSRCPMSNATANPKGSSMHLARSWLTKPADDESIIRGNEWWESLGRNGCPSGRVIRHFEAALIKGKRHSH